MEKPELYFPRDVEWREWLEINHNRYQQGVYLIFNKLETKIPTMRWEEAVKVALCFGWIDATVKSLGGGKRRQYFCPRRKKSGWSALNKQYIEELDLAGLMHESGWQRIQQALEDGSWTKLDDIEKGIIPEPLQAAFHLNPMAYENFNNFSPGYRKSYIRWVTEAKREETRNKRIAEVVRLCAANIKARN
ncbi:YdeI/OmpD-associated family protein [Aureitalea marina]|uniref:Bacteriocin-protection protein n=1 Tax=Aureitalea marina TaxID=930804 RepID=A0A2S7KPQ8_9FLAO|nr:YdeI/OmpD-associated family protein [Aureitalea marina]PQB04616.1 hypothetical protein BST85_06690 [Aureitalea marina]